MKKNKASTSQAAKISDFFSKSPAKNNKRKTSSGESQILNAVDNLPERNIIFNAFSPNAKRFKENGKCLNHVLKTPEKCAASSSKAVTPQSGSRKSPFSSKRTTPKKLFQKSPKKLDEFNVQILENFVKITPSKTTKIDGKESTPNKINNIQTSIVQYMSPSSSEVRNRNESTPTKSPSKQRFSPKKACSRLDFESKSPEKEANSFTNLDDFMQAFDEAEFDDIVQKEDVDSLNLEAPIRCIITTITKVKNCVILRLALQKDASNLSVEEFWTNNVFALNAIVFVQAHKKSDGKWMINNDKGWLVYHPDLLISCTSLVSSLFCKRKTVLSETYQGSKGTNRAMLIGNIVHHLLQTALKHKYQTMQEIEKALTQILKGDSMVHKLYESDLSLSDIASEMESFVPRIHEFIKQYVSGVDRDPRNWPGKIQAIDDIEDNLWCPELGLKGKIDVTIKSDRNVLMPLELKTGKASMSLEHRGQVMLYTMMMNKFGYKVKSGLLLYLREGVLKEVTPAHAEERDILIMRNELAYYLTQKIGQIGGTMQPPALPEPINHRACHNCEMKLQCAAYLRHENKILPAGHHMKDIQEKSIAHLNPAHLSYFMHWSNLLHLEMDAAKTSKNLHEIYTQPAIEREKKGRALINLKIVKITSEANEIFEHRFTKNDEIDNEKNFTTCGISKNNYIVVSTDTRMAIATGFVREITTNSINVALDRNLDVKYKNRLFHLDTYDSASAQSFNFASLSLLLENTPRADQLRRLLIDKSAPSFAPKLPAVIAKRGKPIFRGLNRVQQRAVLTALSAKDYVLIKGMPGTGKTSTIVALIQLLVMLEKSVLISCHTHAAVDNVCMRLKQFDVAFIRLGNEGKIGAHLREHSEFYLTQKCDSPEKLEEIYASFKVVGVTCLGSGHTMLAKRTFDVCIIDESTQALQTSTIRPLFLAKCFILIGDPDQLAPVVRNPDALTAGMGESLFERLDKAHHEAMVILSLNYRMNQRITDLANALTYNNELQPANETVAKATLALPALDAALASYKSRPWVLQALQSGIEDSVQFIDTGAVWKLPKNPEWYKGDAKMSASDLVNVYEIAAVVTLVEAMLKCGVDRREIGVIATYSAQVAELALWLKRFEVGAHTVDQFQGQDKSVIIYSCTKSKDMAWRSNDLKFDILEDKRRLTVAITRSKHKLIIVGDSKTLLNYSTFKTIYNNIDKKQVIALDEEMHSEWGRYIDLKDAN